MAIQRYGRYVTGPEQDMGFLSDNGQQASVYDTWAKTVIVYQLGGWLGRYSGDPKSRLFLARATSAATPGDLLAYTDQFEVDTLYTDVTGGKAEVHDIEPIIASAGRYAIGFTAQNGQVGYSMRQAANVNAANRNFYWKGGLATTVPTNPVGGSPSYEGQMSLWVVSEVNEPPSTPIYREPHGVLNTGDMTPQFESDFNDPNKTLPDGRPFDYLNTVQLTVRRVSDKVVMWNKTYTATEEERNNHRQSIEYAGTPLVAGVPYEWQIRHSDRAGAWSPWSSWLEFTISPAGFVATPSSPTGKITTSTPGPFLATWTHQNGLSTNRVRIRFLINGTVIHTSGELTKTVAPGGQISISWAETGSSNLQWGTEYQYQIQGRDTNGVWSPYSNPATLRTNARPSVPTNMTPNNGAIVDLPVLTARASDPDPDDPESELLVTGWIVDRTTDTITKIATLSWVPERNRFEYQTVPGDFNGYGDYRWYARASDLYLTSAYSPSSYFTYAQVPTITMEEPGTIVDSNNITFDWTVTGTQASFRLRIVDLSLLGSSDIIYDSGVVNSATTSHTTGPIEGLRNGEGYFYYLEVTSPLGAVGSTSLLPITVQYPPADSITGFTASATPLGYDSEPTAVFLQWNQTEYSANEFENYRLFRTPIAGPAGIALGVREELAKITTPQQNVWLDAELASHVRYRYEIIQTVRVGQDLIESVAAQQEIQLDFHGVILGLVTDPEGFHVDLLYPSRRGNEGQLDWRPDITFHTPIGSRLPRPIIGTERPWDPSGSYRIHTDSIATSKDRYQALVDLAEQMRTICFRDGRSEVRYVMLTRVRVTKTYMRHYIVDLDFREVERDLPDDPMVDQIIDIIGGILE